MRRRGDTHRMVRWLWTSRRPDAKLARLALLPVSGLWRAVMAGRGLAYRRGWFPVHDLPLPTVAVVSVVAVLPPTAMPGLNVRYRSPASFTRNSFTIRAAS